MLKLRIILLSNKLYYSLFITCLVLAIIRISIPKSSNFTEKSTHFTGTIIKIIKKEDYTTWYIKQKETIIATYTKNNHVKLGDRVTITGTFKKPSKNTNDYLFNYQEYLQRKNIHFLVSVKKYKIDNSSSNIYYQAKQIIMNYLPKNPYCYTFILGDKSLVKKSIQRSYQENGISHLFALSGMHITLLVNMISKILKLFKIKEDNNLPILSILLIVYLMIVGISPSILRGVLFYILFSINKKYYLYISPTNIFLSVISIALIVNPYHIFDVGFQYSYLISFTLIKNSTNLQSTNYLESLLKVSMLSFIASIPISLYHFYQINFLSIILNLFYVPFISMIVFPLTMIVVIIKPLLPVYNVIINVLEKTSLLLANISFGKIVFKRLPLGFYFAYFMIILLIVIKQKKLYLCILCLLLMIHKLVPYIQTNYLKAIDVGQGDSHLLHINRKNLLIDTGGIRSYYQTDEDTLYYQVLHPILKSEGIHKIDYLILTHGDFDHMGEAINLVNNFKIEKVIFNCGEYNNLEKELIKVLDKKKIKHYSCIKELNIDNNKLYFLQTKDFNDENDNSNVIYTELNGYKFMFMGDASITTEKEILDKYSLPEVDVLKIGHHGSRTSSCKEFINQIKPKYSIISVGKDNKFNHPNKETLETLKNSKIYRTDENGSIMFKIKNNKLKIETCSP